MVHRIMQGLLNVVGLRQVHVSSAMKKNRLVRVAELIRQRLISLGGVAAVSRI